MRHGLADVLLRAPTWDASLPSMVLQIVPEWMGGSSGSSGSSSGSESETFVRLVQRALSERVSDVDELLRRATDCGMHVLRVMGSGDDDGRRSMRELVVALPPAVLPLLACQIEKNAITYNVQFLSTIIINMSRW